ncbi:hypothetical protein [Lamprocystis purpurea]|jgi:hypothetical protein|uniref:hypothetical protein n=1 Tax=Lamprocystis purpurea TaxID=61598 RepID=UPI0003A2415F|nr:hypothetical protein [Lamprocystis purpurea]
MRTLKKFVVLLILAAFALPASAVIVLNPTAPPLAITPFTPNFYPNPPSNDPLPIGNSAFASSLFAGQGWRYTTEKDPQTLAPWELPDGTPTALTDLALLGQFGVTPPGSPAVDETKLQNVVSFDPGAGFLDRFGGMVDNSYQGVTSILFLENLNAFSLQVLDAGINESQVDAGPLHFAFYGRQGNLLQEFDMTASNGTLNFLSTDIDIAGVQIWHQDPRGLEFRTLQFGVVATPETLGLILLGLAALRLASRASPTEP